MSAIKRFRVDVTTVVDGMSVNGVHKLLDAAEEEMLRNFDTWRSDNPINILAITHGRYATHNADDDFYAWMTILYEVGKL